MKSSENISSGLIQITKTSDLLKAKPINEQVIKFGRNDVNVEISKSINKCLRALDISIENSALQILIEDIVDVYKWDSIEDIQICLKNGRQGKYGKTYNKLNMIVFQEWMSKHLDQKSNHLEHQYSKHKHHWDSKEDYLKAVKEGIKQQDKEKEITDADKKYVSDYNNYKMKYETEKGNESTKGTIQPDPKLKNN